MKLKASETKKITAGDGRLIAGSWPNRSATDKQHVTSRAGRSSSADKVLVHYLKQTTTSTRDWYSLLASIQNCTHA